MSDTANQVLEAMACLLAASGFLEIEKCIFEHPVLLTPGIRRELRTAARTLEWTERSVLLTRSLVIDAVQERFRFDGTAHQLGDGPIETIWRQLGDGLLSADQANARVGAPVIAERLSVAYLRALGQLADWEARTGNWQAAVVMATLLLHAVDVPHPDMQDSDEARLWVEQFATVYWAYLSTSIAVLAYYPHGRLLAGAVDRGNLLIAMSADPASAELLGRRGIGSTELLGELHYLLGILYLDPYLPALQEAATSEDGLRPDRIDRLIGEWQRRVLAAAAPGDDIGDDWRLPLVAKALEQAVKHLQRAALLQIGSARGRALKALGQAHSFQDSLGVAGAKEHAINAAREAVGELGEDEDIQPRLSELAYLAANGEPVLAVQLDRLVGIRITQLADTIGLYAAMNCAMTLADLLYRTGRSRDGLALVEEMSPFWSHVTGVTERRRTQLFGTELDLLAQDCGVERTAGNGRARPVRRPPRPTWSARQRSTALVEDARHSVATDAEEEGLALLDESARLDPELHREHDQAIGWLRANLWSNIAVNHLDWLTRRRALVISRQTAARRRTAAVEAYLAALREYLGLNLLDQARGILRKVRDVIENAPFPMATTLVSLANVAEDIDRVGPVAEHELDLIGAVALAREASARSGDDAAIAAMFQMLKGRRTAAAFRRGGGAVTRDARANALLANVRDAERRYQRQLRTGVESTPDPRPNESLLVSDYVAFQAPQWGRDPGEMLTNARAMFDSYVYEQLLAPPAPTAPQRPRWGQVLPADTAICQFYWTDNSATGPMCAGTIVTTQSRHSWVSSMKRGGPVGFVADLVRAARQAILDPNNDENAITSVMGIMDQLLFGQATEYLDGLARAGVRRLVIVPHRALHFFPFHLVGDVARPLGTRFRVTYLPNACLAGHRGSSVPWARRGGPVLAAFGLDFADWHGGAHRLQHAVPEARAIAELFGVSPCLNEDATRDQILHALSHSRYVHFATHGQHDVDAPSFQSMWLRSAAGDYVPLYAYELLPLDLRGLEMVTLGACETALGRTTFTDEVRGLPVNLLLAGARAVVGTLWPVRDDVAEVFFTTLYAQVRAGQPTASAFHRAQLHTRELFPMAKRWGAFFYAGEWRDG